MSENTKIQWTDATLNFWQGCTKVSPGCTNCYAEARDEWPDNLRVRQFYK